MPLNVLTAALQHDAARDAARDGAAAAHLLPDAITVWARDALGPVLGIFAEPEDDGGDDQDGAVVGGAFGVAGGQGAELLEPGEAALDDVAAGIDLPVEGRWAAAGRALGLAPVGLVGAFGAGEGDAAGAQRGPGGGVGVGPVGDHPVRASARSAGAGAGDRDLVEQRQQLRVVPGLAGGEPAAGASEGLAVDGELVDPSGAAPPFFRAPAACW